MYPAPPINHNFHQPLKNSVQINRILRNQNGLFQANLEESLLKDNSNTKSTINTERTSRKRTCLNIHLLNDYYSRFI